MHSTNPEIYFSIVIASYNRADFLPATLASILAQSYPYYEIIVVDDGSTDHTAALLQGEYAEKVRYFYQENGERGKARNLGIAQARGHFVTFLDSDDQFYPHCLAEAVALILQAPQENFFHLGYEMKNPQGKVLMSATHRRGNLNKQLATGNHLSCIAVFVRREVLLEQAFQEDRALAGSEDWELWLRLAARYPIVYNNKAVAAIIHHEHRSVLQVEESKLLRRMQVLMHYAFADAATEAFYKPHQAQMWAHIYLYISLHLLMSNQKRRGIYYWYKAMRSDVRILFTRKTAAIFKKILLA